MAISQEKLHDLIKQSFADAEIKITDLVGDGDHYKVEISSVAFNDKSRVMQHRMVNEALKGYLGDALHALSIKTMGK